MSLYRSATDNSHLSPKAALRREAIGELKEVRVLDAFAGRGLIWKEVKRLMPGLKITVDSIEKIDRPGFYMKGNNIRYLAALDLARYDIIDLDAYSAPIDQLEIIFSRRKASGKRVIIVFTFIMMGLRTLPSKMLARLGLSTKMIWAGWAYLGHNAFDKFKAYLALNGVDSIRYVQPKDTHGHKCYGYFYINL